MRWLGQMILVVTLSLSATVGLVTAQKGTETTAGLGQKRQELQRAEGQLLRSKQQLSHRQAQEQSVLSTLDALSQRQAELARSIRQSERELSAIETRAQTLRQAHAQASQEVENQRDEVVQRLRHLYKLGRSPYVQALTSAKDVAELSQKLRYVRHLAGYDREQLTAYQANRERLAAAQAELETVEQRMQETQHTLHRQQVELAHEDQRKRALLQRIRSEKDLAEQTVAEFEEVAKELGRVIKTLQAEQQERLRQAEQQERLRRSRRSAVSKGQLMWPVRGPILSTFGRVRHPDLDVVTVRKGMYIGAPLGSDIRAVADGVVIYANWFKGLGQLLIVDHGKHVLTLYGHTSELFVEVNDRVEAEQIVAKVGNSSTMGEPALYFAIRQNTAPQDPLLWLRQQSARLTAEP